MNFENNFNSKIQGHLKHDAENGLVSNISVEKATAIQNGFSLFEKQMESAKYAVV